MAKLLPGTVESQLTATCPQQPPLCNIHFFVLGDSPYIGYFYQTSLQQPPLYQGRIQDFF